MAAVFEPVSAFLNVYMFSMLVIPTTLKWLFVVKSGTGDFSVCKSPEDEEEEEEEDDDN